MSPYPRSKDCMAACTARRGTVGTDSDNKSPDGTLGQPLTSASRPPYFPQQTIAMQIYSHTLSPSNVPQKQNSYVGGSSNILSGKLVKKGPYLDRDDERCNLPERHPAMSEIALLAEASSSDPVVHNASHFAVLGETKDSDPDRSLKGIIPGFSVLHPMDVRTEHVIYKGPGYRLYFAKSSGRVVALKVYEGRQAKERCCKDAKFYQDIMYDSDGMHPNIPHLTAVSPFVSKSSFLVFDGEYEGTVDYMLGQMLKKTLTKILILGVQTVIDLSSGLDYLQDHQYPFKSIGLEHFVLLSSKGRVIICFDSEELGQSTRPNEESGEDKTDGDKDVLDIFNGLCTKTFDAARKAHYQNEQIQSTFFDDDEDGIPCDDVPEDEPKINDDQENLGTTQSASKSASKPVLKRRPNGRRQELVWRPPTHETIILSEIFRDFQYFLDTNRSSLEPTLNRRRGRYTARTPHRCPGYNRIEITLTPKITRSAIVTHSSPTLHEICPVCGQVVKDTEILNCICGNDDDELMPTVKCSKCFEWHHRPCVHYFDLDPRNFICGNCRQPLHTSTNAVNHGIRPSFVFEESEGAKESETGPFQTMPADRVPDLSSRFPRRITLNRTEQRVKIESLRSRVSDWKSHHIDNFGELLLDDVFLVTKSHIDRVYHVFLFEKMILFCKEAVQPQKGGGKGTNRIGTFLKKLAAPSPPTLPEIQENTPLVIKGRVFFSNVIQAVPRPEKVMASTVVPQYRYFPLEIWWDGHDYKEFVTLRCRGEDQMSQWETQINDLVEELTI